MAEIIAKKNLKGIVDNSRKSDLTKGCFKKLKYRKLQTFCCTVGIVIADIAVRKLRLCVHRGQLLNSSASLSGLVASTKYSLMTDYD